ncbi:MAG: hypothetical protein KAK04_02925 [Cyclobacteriaceae bacterium]|nr:hypothetical protein [Cyclobacteriaceae bacterium]
MNLSVPKDGSPAGNFGGLTDYRSTEPRSSTGQAVYLPEIELGEHSLAHYEIRE